MSTMMQFKLRHLLLLLVGLCSVEASKSGQGFKDFKVALDSQYVKDSRFISKKKGNNLFMPQAQVSGGDFKALVERSNKWIANDKKFKEAADHIALVIRGGVLQVRGEAIEIAEKIWKEANDRFEKVKAEAERALAEAKETLKNYSNLEISAYAALACVFTVGVRCKFENCAFPLCASSSGAFLLLTLASSDTYFSQR